MIDVTTDKKFTLRIPEELHAELERAAKEDMRSLHSQILVLLREAVERRQAQSGRIKVTTMKREDFS